MRLDGETPTLDRDEIFRTDEYVIPFHTVDDIVATGTSQVIVAESAVDDVWGVAGVTYQYLNCQVADSGCGKALCSFLDRAQAGFKLVAELHQFIDFGDDAFLFSQRGKGKRNTFTSSFIKVSNSS